MQPSSAPGPSASTRDTVAISPDLPIRTPGSVVGNYELIERIGAGGMGEVWKARDQLLNRIVALKFLAASSSMPSSARDLVQEARAASALNHPNIVTIFQVGESDGVTYLAMEYVEGESLRRHIRETRPAVDEALDISRQIVDGLASAHARGIIHRDLKPENIMLRVDGCVKLVDFGLAKQLLRDESTTGQVASEMSQSGHLVGTFNYMSPEQARGQPISTASDVFSLGIVMYELLSGRNPFRRDQVLETLNAIVGTQPPALAEACPTAPPGVVDIVSKSLEKEPSSRYSSAVMIGEPLARARREWDQTATHHRVAAPKRYAPPAARLAGALGLVALLLVTGWSLFQSQRVDAVGQSVQSVAVLTLRANDANAASLAESFPEDLGGALAKAGFQVASRGGVLQIDGAANPRSAGVELGVDAVLDGTVRIQGSTVRVYMELINSQTGFQMWSGTFTADADALVSGDPRMAAEVAERVRAAVVAPR